MRFLNACRNRFALALALAAVLLAAAPARAELIVDITSGFVEPLPIAITDFFGEATEEAKVGADIAGVIAANLERSGLFRPIDKGAFIQDPNTLRAGPRFGSRPSAGRPRGSETFRPARSRDVRRRAEAARGRARGPPPPSRFRSRSRP